ncbi:hypothetical protein JOF28_001453 [Leucobacter exalbidus]|uniref:Glycosyl transferase family 11 n=1 Tax=Leucobacter exalbidus TaxID=662960 RepID=A0A940T5Q6_9MICO|nr:alpha-1,2-fucosyltransferase [Leucobacter exalbidus]MBP1326221.1 hypothetical protein [Leucobacter exalbidus]
MMPNLSLSQAKASLLSVVRRGPREVLWTPANVNLGNLLYYWLNAHLHQAKGEPRFALETEKSKLWQEAFPKLFEELVISRSELRLTDRRIEQHPLQHFGLNYTGAELDAFIAEMLLGTPTQFASELARINPPADLTINIRRGDYYSVPRWRGDYSFDVVEYVRVAVAAAQATGEITSILLVSDDLEWCHTKLGWLTDIAPVSEPPAGATVLHQLALLAASPRLILTNSTFGYWGGYIADVLRASAQHKAQGTWAPAFHSRAFPGNLANQLSDRWNVIEQIPGGWDG